MATSGAAPDHVAPLRIVFLVKRFWPDVGGVEKYIFELARAVREQGHRVDIVAGDPTGQRPRFEEHAGLRLHRFSSRRSRWRIASQLCRVVPVLRSADVLNISDIEMLEFYQRMLAWRVAPKAVCLTRHGMSGRDPVSQAERERHIRARAAVAAIFDDGEFIHRRYGVMPDSIPKPGLRPRAIDLEPHPEPDRLSAVFIGRIEPDTGLDIYLEALIALRDRFGLTLPLSVYGDGSCKPDLFIRARSAALAIDWHVAQPDAQQRLWQGTVAFVSGRMAICEAMARRRLVAAAWVDPLKRDYILGEWFSPCLVAAPTGKELAERLHPFLTDAARRAARVERAFQAVVDLDWHRTADEYLRVWRRCLTPVPRSLIEPADRQPPPSHNHRSTAHQTAAAMR